MSARTPGSPSLCTNEATIEPREWPASATRVVSVWAAYGFDGVRTKASAECIASTAFANAWVGLVPWGAVQTTAM